MTPRDLSVYARQNASLWPTRVDLGKAVNREFVDHCRSKGTVSVNIRLTPLVQLGIDGTHQNIYEWAKDEAVLSRRSEEACLQQRLDKYYDRRILFERECVNGRRFRYGAFNTGSLGPCYYGDFCLFLGRASCEADPSLVFLEGNSLERFVSLTPEVDWAGLEQAVATFADVPLLALVKLGSQMGSLPVAGWPGLICHDSDYLEAIFTEQIHLNRVEEAWVSAARYKEYFRAAFDATVAPQSSSYLEKAAREALNADFKRLRSWEQSGRIKIRKV